MEEFREELNKYVATASELQDENAQLHNVILKLKSQLQGLKEKHADEIKQLNQKKNTELEVERAKMHDVFANLRSQMSELKESHIVAVADLRNEYTMEIEYAKENWRDQAINFGERQRLLGRNDVQMLLNEGSNLNNSHLVKKKLAIRDIQHKKNIDNAIYSLNASGVRDDVIVSNAFIASTHGLYGSDGEPSVVLCDFDVSDGHVLLINTTTVTINLKGSYVTLQGSGGVEKDRFVIQDDVILHPKGRLSIWWTGDHHHQHQHRSAFRHSVRAKATSAANNPCCDSLYWDRKVSSHDEAHHIVRLAASSIFNKIELYDNNSKFISRIVSNEAMFCSYYKYPIDAAAMLAECDPNADSKSSVRDGHKKPNVASNSNNANKEIILHSHYTRQNNSDVTTLVEEIEMLCTDYNSDILSKCHRHSKRNLGKLHLISDNIVQSEVSNHQSALSPGPKPKSKMTTKLPMHHYDLSVLNYKSHIIDVDKMLLNNCITLEHLGNLKRNPHSNNSDNIELHSKCSIQLIFNNTPGFIETADTTDSHAGSRNISVPLGQQIHIAADTQVLLIDAGGSSRSIEKPRHYHISNQNTPHKPSTSASSGIGGKNSTGGSGKKAKNSTPTNLDIYLIHDLDLIFSELSYISTALSNKQIKTQIESNEGDVENTKSPSAPPVETLPNTKGYIHEIPICYCNVVDQHNNILYCALVVKTIVIPSYYPGAMTFAYVPCSVLGDFLEKQHNSQLLDVNSANTDVDTLQNNTEWDSNTLPNSDVRSRKRKRVDGNEDTEIDINSNNNQKETCTIQ